MPEARGRTPFCLFYSSPAPQMHSLVLWCLVQLLWLGRASAMEKTPGGGGGFLVPPHNQHQKGEAGMLEKHKKNLN